jgi:hypothetical protein
VVPELTLSLIQKQVPLADRAAPAHWLVLDVPSAETSFWPVEAVPLAL